MYRSILIGLLAIGLLAPAATVSAQSGASGSDSSWAYIFAGQTQMLKVEVGPNAVLFTIEGIEVSGELASDARTAIDNLQSVGDGDGSLSEDEVVSFEALASATINSQLPNQFDFGMITIDGKRAFADEDSVVELTELDITGAEGDVGSTSPITTDISAILRFESVSASASTHTIRFENLYGDFTGFDAQDAPPANIEVSGYRGWDIDADSIQPSEFQDRLSDDTMALSNSDFAYFDELGDAMVFDINGDPGERINRDAQDSPSIGVVGLLSVLGLALVGLRRRA